jgi:hypothetical protein
MAPPCGSGAAAGLSQSCRACSGPGARAAAAAALIHAPPAVVDGTRLEWDRWREAARPRRLQGSHGVLSALVATAGRASSAARRWPAGPYKTDAPLRWAGVRRGGRAGSAWHWDAACWLASSSPARPATAPSVHAWRGPGCLRRNGASQVRLGRAREPAGHDWQTQTLCCLRSAAGRGAGGGDGGQADGALRLVAGRRGAWAAETTTSRQASPRAQPADP